MPIARSQTSQNDALAPPVKSGYVLSGLKEITLTFVKTYHGSYSSRTTRRGGYEKRVEGDDEGKEEKTREPLADASPEERGKATQLRQDCTHATRARRLQRGNPGASREKPKSGSSPSPIDIARLPHDPSQSHPSYLLVLETLLRYTGLH